MGDAEKGKELFMKMCYQCHTYEQGGQTKAGPNLYNVLGRMCGCKSTGAGLEFDSFLKYTKTRWDETTMDAYLEDPKKYMPTTGKDFAGVKNPEDRKDIIAFLKTLQPPAKQEKKEA